MHLEDRIKNGMTFYEHGHTDPIDIEQEKELEAQRRHCKEVMFDYNNTRPSENVKKKEILKENTAPVKVVSAVCQSVGLLHQPMSMGRPLRR